MHRPVIGIAANQEAPGANPFFDVTMTLTPSNFIQGVLQVGGLPLVLPISSPDLAKEYIDKIDKLLLAGGQDVSPHLFGEEPHPKLKQTDIERDLFEQALIKEAMRQHKPIFAVCRGMQLLNVSLGGNLYQDLASYDNWHINHQQLSNPHYPSHSITLKEASLLTNITQQTTLQVNSFHHQALKELAPDLVATAYSKDNIIEAIEHENYPLLGVQWHPELSYDKNPLDLALFDYFVNRL